MKIEINPKLDLVLERTVDVPRDLVWKAWTTPEHVMKWFVPKPWSVADCEIELRPGGKFRTVMKSPEGQEFDNSGCYLEIVDNTKLSWTSSLQPGFRPTPTPKNPHELAMTAIILLEDCEGGTKYTAIAMHGEEGTRKTHEEMGFHDGWGTVLNQLVEEIKKGNIK